MEPKANEIDAEIEAEFALPPASADACSSLSGSNDFNGESQSRAKEKYMDAIQAYQENNIEEGIQSLEVARQLDPQNVDIVILSEKLKELLCLRSESRADYFDENYDQAKTKIQRCIAIIQDIEIPNISMEAKMVMKLSVIAHKVGDRDWSFHYVNKALELNASFLNAFLHRAHLHRLNNDWHETIKDLEAAKKIDSHLSKKPYSAWINEANVEAKKMQK